MPKDEFDFDDPMELSGVALSTEEDTTEAMCECFIEEFLRMGYDHQRVLALFRNPSYLGPNLVLQNRGEPFVRHQIAQVFARWGGAVTWPQESRSGIQPVLDAPDLPTPPATSKGEDTLETCPALIDPTGAPIPQLDL